MPSQFDKRGARSIEPASNRADWDIQRCGDLLIGAGHFENLLLRRRKISKQLFVARLNRDTA